MPVTPLKSRRIRACRARGEAGIGRCLSPDQGTKKSGVPTDCIIFACNAFNTAY
jgi:hypothetical protein